ncbi:vegetative cell wall protein gp1-like [Poecilia reticulata]|uniref:vegetative cell wall protein gp1-like n=1 Tax=Poecilia reticulata TaxID=8081 RepID=UPI0007EBA5D4|nr:PREDICTED: vegetative cell wall protein gp1-like [Poecilia reticulata]
MDCNNLTVYSSTPSPLLLEELGLPSDLNSPRRQRPRQRSKRESSGAVPASPNPWLGSRLVLCPPGYGPRRYCHPEAPEIPAPGHRRQHRLELPEVPAPGQSLQLPPVPAPRRRLSPPPEFPVPAADEQPPCFPEFPLAPPPEFADDPSPLLVCSSPVLLPRLQPAVLPACQNLPLVRRPQCLLGPSSQCPARPELPVSCSARPRLKLRLLRRRPPRLKLRLRLRYPPRPLLRIQRHHPPYRPRELHLLCHGRSPDCFLVLSSCLDLVLFSGL